MIKIEQASINISKSRIILVFWNASEDIRWLLIRDTD